MRTFSAQCDAPQTRSTAAPVLAQNRIFILARLTKSYRQFHFSSRAAATAVQHIAAACGNTGAVRALLAGGGGGGGSGGAASSAARPNVRASRCGGTPLPFATRSGHARAATALLRAGAFVDTPSAGGETALTAAAVRGDADLLSLLLSANQARSWAAGRQYAAPASVLAAAASGSGGGGVYSSSSAGGGGAGVRVKGGRGGGGSGGVVVLSALHEAAGAGQAACVAVLLHVSPLHVMALTVCDCTLHVDESRVA
jgi:Ankyrin repeats (3 copies)